VAKNYRGATGDGERKVKVAYVYADSPEEWNSSEWRCSVPARAINHSGRHKAALLGIEDFADNTGQAVEICSQADLIVVQRNLFGPVLSAIQYWKARDKVVVVDFDDAYNLMHKSNLNYRFWSQGVPRQPGMPKMEPAPLTQFKWGLRLSHAATVPSKRLADDWQAFTEMHYLPNYIDLKNYEYVAHDTHSGIVIGWGGSISHLQSFKESGVTEALRRVCKARPQVQVMICGNDQRIVDAIQIPARQKLFQNWVSYQEWPRRLSQFDIGIAPLSGHYDERRSWIKVLEYMVMKLPWVASDAQPYRDFRQYGWLVNNEAEAWENVLLDIVDNLDRYREQANGDPYLKGISLSVDENIENIMAVYATIYERATTLL
jgi:glycosyltransferase involved in cell wall biosynthesis